MQRTTIAKRRIVRHKRPSWPCRRSLRSLPYTYDSLMNNYWAPLGAMAQQNFLGIFLETSLYWDGSPNPDTVLRMNLYPWLTRFRSMELLMVNIQGCVETLSEFDHKQKEWDKLSYATETMLDAVYFPDLFSLNIAMFWKGEAEMAQWSQDDTSIVKQTDWEGKQDEGILEQAVEWSHSDTLTVEQMDREDELDGETLGETAEEGPAKLSQAQASKRKRRGKKNQRARGERKLKEYKEQGEKAQQRPSSPSLKAESEPESAIDSKHEVGLERRLSVGFGARIVQDENADKEEEPEEPESQVESKSPTSAPLDSAAAEDDGIRWNRVLSKKYKKKVKEPEAPTANPTKIRGKVWSSNERKKLRKAKAKALRSSGIQESEDTSAPNVCYPRIPWNSPDRTPSPSEDYLYEVDVPAPCEEIPRSDSSSFVVIRLPGSTVRQPQLCTPHPLKWVPFSPASLQQSCKVAPAMDPRKPSPKTRRHSSDCTMPSLDEIHEAPLEASAPCSESPKGQETALSITPSPFRSLQRSCTSSEVSGPLVKIGKVVPKEHQRVKGLDEFIREDVNNDDEPFFFYSRLSVPEYHDLIRLQQLALDEQLHKTLEELEEKHPHRCYTTGTHTSGGKRRASDPGAPVDPLLKRESRAPTPVVQSPFKYSPLRLSRDLHAKEQEIKPDMQTSTPATETLFKPIPLSMSRSLCGKEKGGEVQSSSEDQDSSGVIQSAQSSTQRPLLKSQKDQHHPQLAPVSGLPGPPVHFKGKTKGTVYYYPQLPGPGTASTTPLNGSAPVFQPQNQRLHQQIAPLDKQVYPQPGRVPPGQRHHHHMVLPDQQGYLRPGRLPQYSFQPVVSPVYGLVPFNPSETINFPNVPPPAPQFVRQPVPNPNLSPGIPIGIPHAPPHDPFPVSPYFQKPRQY